MNELITAAKLHPIWQEEAKYSPVLSVKNISSPFPSATATLTNFTNSPLATLFFFRQMQPAKAENSLLSVLKYFKLYLHWNETVDQLTFQLNQMNQIPNKKRKVNCLVSDILSLSLFEFGMRDKTKWRQCIGITDPTQYSFSWPNTAQSLMMPSIGFVLDLLYWLINCARAKVSTTNKMDAGTLNTRRGTEGGRTP